MYCIKCGEKIESDSKFCSNCGTKIITEIESEMTIEETVISITKPKSMKWYKALMYFFIPAWLVLSPISVFGNLYTRILNYYGSWGSYFSEIPNALSFLLYFLNMVFLLIAFIELRKFTSKGYKYILYFFILATIYPVLEMLIFVPTYLKANVAFNYAETIGRTLGASLFYIPNIIYFKKRSHLFNAKELHSLKIK